MYTGVGETMLVTYEQVSKINPQLDRPRPIMLVAPRGGPFDMERLKTNIVETNLQRFGFPIKRKFIKISFTKKFVF